MRIQAGDIFPISSSCGAGYLSRCEVLLLTLSVRWNHQHRRRHIMFAFITVALRDDAVGVARSCFIKHEAAPASTAGSSGIVRREFEVDVARHWFTGRRVDDVDAHDRPT